MVGIQIPAMNDVRVLRDGARERHHAHARHQFIARDERGIGGENISHFVVSRERRSVDRK